jgi:hypothetical protein
MMGSVKVDELTGFWHTAELLFAAQVLEESDDEAVVVAALRGSTTRSGTAMFIIDSIMPTASALATGAGIRGPSL